MRELPFADPYDHDVDAIKELMRESLAGLTLDKILPERGIPAYRRDARQLIHNTLIKVVEQMISSGISQEEWGHEIIIEGLVCLAADLYKRRLKSQ